MLKDIVTQSSRTVNHFKKEVVEMTTTQAVGRPIDRFLPLLKGHRSYSNGRGGYTASCPGPTHRNGDRSHSLMIWEDANDGHVGLQCFTGCTREEIVAALHITEYDLYIHDGSHQKHPPRQVIEVCDLMLDKVIRPILLDQWGIHNGTKEECTFRNKDGTPFISKGVVIPYHNLDGTIYSRYRVRTALKAKNGTFWNDWDEKTQGKAPPLIPYGLHKLEDARKRNALVIVEGESDCWTLWQHGFPALGIPGVSNYSTLQLDYLKGIDRIYIIQEPGDAGEKFPPNVYKHLQKIKYTGKVYAVNLHERTGCKDPNDLQKKDMKAFAKVFQQALDNAYPLFPIGPKPVVERLCDLLLEVLPEMKWAIPDILPEGLTWLCGKPKLGKSWLLLAMLLAIACGGVVLGSMPVDEGEVLYISLEDNKRRLQKRSNQLLTRASASPNFYYATKWPRLDEGGIEQLEEWIEQHPKLRVIGIDTWAKIKPRAHGQRNQQYDEDYDALTPLQELASKHGIAIVVVHHMRKQESEDPLDMISGSTAMQGAVDGFLLLYRKRGETDARLFVTGRDIEEEQELMLTFNQECATWTVKGNADEVASTPERQEILDTMRVYGKPISKRELVNLLGKNPNTVRNLLVSLRNEGKILLKNDVYSLVIPSHRSHPSHPSHPSHVPEIPDYGNDYMTMQRSHPSHPHSHPLTSPVEPLQTTENSRMTRMTRDTTHNARKFYDDFCLQPGYSLRLEHDDQITIGVPTELSDPDFEVIRAEVDALGNALLQVLREKQKDEEA